MAELARPSERGTLPYQGSTLVVRVGRETGEGVAREDTVGPLLLEQVRELLAHDRVRLLPVIDLAGDPGADGYEVPTRIREQVRIRDPFSVFPFSTMRSMNADLDHTEPFRDRRLVDHDHPPPRQTRPSNLGPLGRLEHRAKSHGRWRVSQTEPGVFEWRSPIGYHYRVSRGYTEWVGGAPSASRDTAVARCDVDIARPACLALVNAA